MRQTLLTSLFAALCSLPFPTFADQGSAMDPSNLCEGTSCSEPMLNVSRGYKEGFADFANIELTGYSGKCFHLNSIYDPDFAHFGAFTFLRNGASVSINGIFGFFYESDPYAGMSAAEMRTTMADNGSKASDGILRPDHVELVYKSTNSEIRYWFRSDKSKNVLFVIGRQVDGSNSPSMVFCKLRRH